MKIIDGKKVKAEILEELRLEVSKLKDKPNFVVVQVGDNPASNAYIGQKAKMTEYVGYGYQHLKFDENIKEEKLISEIENLNNNKDIHGIIVQMPLPEHIDTDRVLNTILPEKDVDGLTDLNAGLLFHGKDALYSCTPYGIMELLKRYNLSVEGKHAVIVGRSNLVGKPMASMLINAGATVTVCHSKTVDLEKYTKKADILIVAVGKPRFVTGDMVRRGTVVIDVGISRLAEGLCGDVDYESVAKKASYITPVPGGVGPMTVAMLASNVLKAYKIQKDL